MDETLFASTTPGLEDALHAEAQALGWARRVEGGEEITGPRGLHRRANLWLRTASRVLLRLAVVEAPNRAALVRGLEKVSLAAVREKESAVVVDASVDRAKLHKAELGAVARKVWPSPAGSTSNGALGLWLRLEGNRCTVSVDTSGELLYRRGYRQEISRAPMRETLAAGLLMLAGYRGDEPLWDPLCGSGTIAIEAALIALRRAPGLQRHFAFERWPSHDAAAWDVEKREGGGLGALPAPIYGSDLHAGSLGTARRNARRAGLEGLIELTRHDATKTRRGLPRAGLLASNLPYGVRLGERRELVALFRGLGRTLRGLPDWRAALLVADEDVEQELGWTPQVSSPLENGGLRCRLLVGPLGTSARSTQ